MVNPWLPGGGGSGGVVDFSQMLYPGFGSNVDLRARGTLSRAVVMRASRSLTCQRSLAHPRLALDHEQR